MMLINMRDVHALQAAIVSSWPISISQAAAKSHSTAAAVHAAADIYIF
jgi:hypothetical protein